MLNQAIAPLVLLLLLAATAATQETNVAQHLVLEKMGVMFVGGREVEMPGGGR